jgi:hypothetical protein
MKDINSVRIGVWGTEEDAGQLARFAVEDLDLPGYDDEEESWAKVKQQDFQTAEPDWIEPGASEEDVERFKTGPGYSGSSYEGE